MMQDHFDGKYPEDHVFKVGPHNISQWIQEEGELKDPTEIGLNADDDAAAWSPSEIAGQTLALDRCGWILSASVSHSGSTIRTTRSRQLELGTSGRT